MASILRVNTLTDASSNNSTAMSTVFNGTAKAYLTYNNAGSIQDSFNIGSVTDVGTGEYITVFTSNLSNANYVTAGTTIGGTNSTYNGPDKDEIVTTVIEIYHVNASDASTDANLSMGSVHGDLA